MTTLTIPSLGYVSFRRSGLLARQDEYGPGDLTESFRERSDPGRRRKPGCGKCRDLVDLLLING